MASVCNDPGGRKRILFSAPDGSRKAIRLGKVPKRTADCVCGYVERLLAAALTGSAPDAEVSLWVAALDVTMHDKLAAVGLVAKRGSAKLGEFLAGYIAGRTDLKPGTLANLERARHELVAHFGAERPLRDITPGDADQWRLGMAARGLADNTVRRTCGRAKQFFHAARRRRLVQENPFADLKAAVQGNASKFRFVTRDEAAKLLDACPDAQWRLIVALSRFGGLRCPSEHLALRWGDIDWEHDRIRVPSPKTEHHAGRGERWIPMFPELRPHLESTFEAAEPGTEFVITMRRDTRTNLRTEMLRIIRRAGLKAWPKPFQNLRSTRETELAETFPLHVVCAWIGNTQPVAQKHYLQVTDEHFQRASTGGAKSGAQAAQNTAQQPAAEKRTEPQDDSQPIAVAPVFAAGCDPLLLPASMESYPARIRT